MMRTASCVSLYLKAQGMTTLRATGIFIIISLLLSVVSVDAYRGVSKRKDSSLYHCEVTFVGSSPREKIWVGTYPTEALAALACDVVFFYTNRPSIEFNLEWSGEAILRNCKPRSFYGNLHNWNDRKNFIKAEANALMKSLHWEDIVVPPSVPSVRQNSELRQSAGEISVRIVDYFRRTQLERLPELMTWLMNPSNEQHILLEVHAQKPSQQQREAQESQLYIESEVTGPDVELYGVMRRIQSLQGRSGGNLWLLLMFGSSLPFIFKLFETKGTGDVINNASVNANDTTCTDQESHQSRSLEIATKRQKVSYLCPDREGWFTAINYFIKDKAWRCTGFDLLSKTWRTLPPFSFLPPPDVELFKEYSVSGHGGLMCADISKLPKKDELVVFNPLTGKRRSLPPLLYPRSPVLVHMSVDSATQSYKVIVAGSSTASDERLSKKMEVFDSKTSKWEEACDLPGPAFGLNEHQAGVCVNGVLYFISFLEDNCRNVIAFDAKNGKWLENMACPIPFSLYSNTLQLVESDGKVYLFSEQEHGGSVEHCIDMLEFSNPNAGAVEKCYWRNVVRVRKSGGRGLQVYPENTCVAFGEGKLCVFNTLTRDGVVYEMQDGRQCEELQPPPPDQEGDNFFSLNPASFTLQPSFDSDPVPPPTPPSADAI